MELSDEDILRLAKKDIHIKRQLGAMRRHEIAKEEEEQKKRKREQEDDKVAQKMIGATIEHTTIEMYRHGEYADYEPTQIKLFTSKGHFVVCDPYEEVRPFDKRANEEEK